MAGAFRIRADTAAASLWVDDASGSKDVVMVRVLQSRDLIRDGFGVARISGVDFDAQGPAFGVEHEACFKASGKSIDALAFEP